VATFNLPTDSQTAREMCRTWHDWTKSLSCYCRSQRGGGISERDYQRQHAAVLRAIANCRRELGDIALLRRGEALASPWVNLEACRVAPNSIQRDLLDQCQEFEREISGLPRRRSPVPWRVMSVGFAVGVLLLLFMSTGFFDSLVFVSDIRLGLLRVGFWIRHTSLFERFTAGVLAMFTFGWWMLHSLRTN